MKRICHRPLVHDLWKEIHTYPSLLEHAEIWDTISESYQRRRECRVYFSSGYLKHQFSRLTLILVRCTYVVCLCPADFIAPEYEKFANCHKIIEIGTPISWSVIEILNKTFRNRFFLIFVSWGKFPASKGGSFQFRKECTDLEKWLFNVGGVCRLLWLRKSGLVMVLSSHPHSPAKVATL